MQKNIFFKTNVFSNKKNPFEKTPLTCMKAYSTLKTRRLSKFTSYSSGDI